MDLNALNGPALPPSLHADIVHEVDQGICVIEVEFDLNGAAWDYRFLETNPAFALQTGLSDVTGRSMREIRPEHEQHWFDLYGRVARTGEPTRFQGPAAALGRWFDVFAFRIGRPEENRVAVVFSDVTERKRTEERLQILAAEMAHRAKNTLAVVSSIARLSQAEDVETYKEELLGRLAALSHSQHLVEAAHGRGADLAALIDKDLAGFQLGGAPRVTQAGPDVLIAPGSAQTFALGLHELATNSAKYGALSAPGGRVAIDWSWQGDLLAWRWTESGGPPVQEPPREGLGVALVRSVCRDEVDGGASAFHWHPTGLVCELLLPARIVIRP